MHNLRYGLTRSAFVLIALLGLCRSGWTQGQPVTFSGVGDIPYSNSEAVVFQKQIPNHNIYSPSAFAVHVGDIGVGGSACVESNYALVANMMKGFGVPVYIVTGDNEMSNCNNQMGAYNLWLKYYRNFEDNFCGAPPTEHQTENPANFAFVLNGVLFIGIDLSGGPMPVTHEANWVKQQLQAKGAQVRAAVIFSHFPPNENTTFSTPFRQAAVTFNKPILFLHGHGHSWSVGYPFPEKNILKIQVSKGASEDPVQFTVTTNTSSPATAFLIKRKPWLIKTVVNMPPCASAGTDQTLPPNATSTTLQGRVGDDGDPVGSTVTSMWTRVSGPGPVSFDTPTLPKTVARFALPGVYVLHLTADDSQLQNSDEVTITSQGFADIKPLLAVNDLKINEGDDGTLTAFFTVTLANPNGKTITVDYEVRDSTAANGSDYVFSPLAGNLTFSNWTRKRRLAVTINGDELDEPDEIFMIRLKNAVNATIVDDEGIAKIANDDMPVPPSEPAVLRAKTIAANAADISWKDLSNNEDGFKLERSAGLAPFAEIATLGANVNFYNDTGLNPGTIYFYRAYAFNTNGSSIYSNTDSTETASNIPTTPGVNLALNRPTLASITNPTYPTAHAVDGNSKDTYWRSGSVPLDSSAWLRVDLGSVLVIGRAAVKWKDVYSSKNYSLQVSNNNSTWTTIYNNKAGVGGNEDFWFAPSLGRYVRLLMTNGVKDSYRINEFEVYAAEITSAPAAPTNLVAAATSSSSIGITWSHNSNDEFGFEIERAINGGTFNYITTLSPNSTFYNDSGLRAKTNYVYRVRAYNFVDDSPYSNQAAATTLDGNAAPNANVNMALGKTLAGSSNTDVTKPATLAADTSVTTYWSTTTNAASWLRVDLGQHFPVGRAVVRWQDTFYAKTYEIQVSNDDLNWTTVYAVLAGASGAQDLTFPQAAARYVRLNLLTANKTFYQIQEFEIYTGASTAIAKRRGETAEAAETNVVPQEYVLEQNYPNPFNPSTQIHFGLPKDSRVTIKLFSITGAEVRTLVDADYSAGTHAISFHARNLPSGTYFYVMQAGTVRQVRRLTLLK